MNEGVIELVGEIVVPLIEFDAFVEPTDVGVCE